MWQDNGKKQSFNGRQAFLRIPLNAHYQHHNGSGSEPVRYFAVTSAPLYINCFHNLDFIFDNPFAFGTVSMPATMNISAGKAKSGVRATR